MNEDLQEHINEVVWEYNSAEWAAFEFSMYLEQFGVEEAYEITGLNSESLRLRLELAQKMLRTVIQENGGEVWSGDYRYKAPNDKIEVTHASYTQK